jgi:hypothetical protein
VLTVLAWQACRSIVIEDICRSVPLTIRPKADAHCPKVQWSLAYVRSKIIKCPGS